MNGLEEFNPNTTMVTKCEDAAMGGMVVEVPYSLWSTDSMMVSLLLVEGVGNMSKYNVNLSTLIPPQSGDMHSPASRHGPTTRRLGNYCRG